MKCECSDDVRSRSPHGACSLMSVHVDFWLTSLLYTFPRIFVLAFPLFCLGTIWVSLHIARLLLGRVSWTTFHIKPLVLLFFCIDILRISFIVQTDSCLSCFTSVDTADTLHQPTLMDLCTSSLVGSSSPCLLSFLHAHCGNEPPCTYLLMLS